MVAEPINAYWARIIVEELSAAGIETAIVAPGSRSTPLTIAFTEHPDIEAVSILDERSAAFFALGYGKRTGTPAPLICTSGTAVANFHPAVVEAGAARVPMLLLTADRPPELADSGANQTIDQEPIYGGAVRDSRTLPEPEAADRKLRSLRTAISRSVATATGIHPGAVHLNVPFRKPLGPTVDTGSIPDGVPKTDVLDSFEDSSRLSIDGRDGPYVKTTIGRTQLSATDRDRIAEAIESADCGLIVCGPVDQGPSPEAVAALADASGFPVLADPLSGLRFGPHVESTTICGGYDGYLSAIDATPDVVVRFGASPTSKALRRYLRDSGARQFLVDPAGGWREASFTATDLVVADGESVAADVAGAVDRNPGTLSDRFIAAERDYWSLVDGDEPPEGAILADAVKLAPDPATLFVSNSMPVRDLDRFGRPRSEQLTTLGNRGASGIDGIVSTALGAGRGTDDPLVLVTGDLAYHHDMNGLVAVGRADVDATIVCLNNDGGGIFHLLPIESHSTFEEWFRTPHGLNFEHSAALFDLSFARTDTREGFRKLYAESVDAPDSRVIEIILSGEANHKERRRLEQTVAEMLETD